MHLYVIRLPEIERVWHLHPEQDSAGKLRRKICRRCPRGAIGFTRDIVHATGLAETLVTELDIARDTGPSARRRRRFAAKGHRCRDSMPIERRPIYPMVIVWFGRNLPRSLLDSSTAFNFELRIAMGSLPATCSSIWECRVTRHS